MKKFSTYSKRALIGLVIMTLLLPTIGIEITNGIPIIENNYEKNPSLLSLTPHGAISITADSGFNTYGFPGSGTAIDPYRIENYYITSTNEKGIYIFSTTLHFRINNCYISTRYNCIYIKDVKSGTAMIINNTCTNSDHSGIFLEHSQRTIIVNNTCINNEGIGIYLRDRSTGCTLTNNTCRSH